MPPLPKEMTRRERKAAKTVRSRVPKHPKPAGGLAGKQVKKTGPAGGRSKGATKRAVNTGSR